MNDKLPRRKRWGITRHPVLDTACPVLDTGESSSLLWIPASAGMTTFAASIEE